MQTGDRNRDGPSREFESEDHSHCRLPLELDTDIIEGGSNQADCLLVLAFHPLFLPFLRFLAFLRSPLIRTARVNLQITKINALEVREPTRQIHIIKNHGNHGLA